MTVVLQELIWTQECDYCELTCYRGELAYYNPNSGKVYHEQCLQPAEIG